LQEIPESRASRNGTRLGLYHTAFLFPTREALAVLHLQSRECRSDPPIIYAAKLSTSPIPTG
jgi:catechol-2,3-dioxygenase